MHNNLYELQIIVNGRQVTEFRDKDHDVWIEGRPKSEYKIKVINRSSFRVKAVINVDGLNILTGKENSPNGYIIDSFGNIEIPGWRIDATKAAAFVFEDKHRSYSNRVGKGTDNTGVIGVKIYQEDVPFSSYYARTIVNRPIGGYSPTWDWGDKWGSGSSDPYKGILRGMGGGITSSVANVNAKAESLGSFTSTNSDIFIGAMAAAPQEVGTGWGDEKSFDVQDIDFKSKSSVDAVMIMYYDTYQNLVNNGVIEVTKPKPRKPNAFPTVGCEPPKW